MTFVILLCNVLDLTPIVFLKIAEDQVGESDIIYVAKPATNISYSADKFSYSGVENRNVKDKWISPFINITKMDEEIINSTYYEGITPRWISLIDIANTTNKNLTTPGFLLVLDSQKEVQIGLGREFSKTVLNNREAFITKSLLKYWSCK